MPIDTSSYYPETPGLPEGESLNSPSKGLFGPTEPAKPVETVSHESAPAESAPVDPASTRADAEEDVSGDPHPNHVPTVWTVLADVLATSVSWLLVPLMMPVYGMLLIFSLSILDIAPAGIRTVFTLIVAAFNLVVPAILVWMLKKMGVVQDLGLNERRERLVPYLITVACMGATGFFMWYKGAPLWVAMFFAGGALAGLVNAVVNLRWKISAHAAGVAGIVALLVRIIKDGYPEPAAMVWLVVSILAAGLLGSARIWLGRHTVWQVLAGYAVGFCSVFFLTMI